MKKRAPALYTTLSKSILTTSLDAVLKPYDKTKLAFIKVGDIISP